MPNKMLIDASHREETRVVVVRGNRIEEFDFESQDKKQLRGNIYLARVTRVEPSLQAAFVEYGGNRHGFLAFSEIHPDYYQIPVADRQALLRAEAEAAAADDDDEEDGRGRRRRRSGGGNGGGDREAAAAVEAAETHSVSESVPAGDAEAPAAQAGDDENGAGSGDDRNGGDGNGGDEGEVENVGAEDTLEEARKSRRPMRKNYKIQEVIKRRQIMLVQVVKEERGNKGAALTTYLSLAGRYSVLMPNTARGGGISRKITTPQDRKRLKEVVRDLEVPEGMGVILRTAGQSRTKAEIKRDYEYLMRMWDTVRNLTMQSVAPALVYEEGSLIKRSVRDLYNKDIDEILVAGEDGYREAKDFMRMLMPSHAKVVQPYRDKVPIFARNGIEGQLDRMVQPQVTLKSGGYIIINQTEALVAIDVNSGRSTKEHSIEDTALQTNLEAAEEVARQLRLRDLAGLIVIDFIDMEENRNNRAVEKKLKDCLKNDRARIQVGRISHFGLLEMSRQRIRASVLESTMQPCPHCGGTGHVRSDSSVALLVIRAIEEFLLKDSKHHITVRTPTATALYVLNHKRSTLTELENRFGPAITIEADDSVGAQHYVITRGAISERIVVETPKLEDFAIEEEDDLVIEEEEADEAEEVEAEAQEQDQPAGTRDDGPHRKKRRRRRRRGRDREGPAGEAPRPADAVASGSDEQGFAEPAADAGDGEDEGEGATAASGENGDRKRRRGRRGGRRNRRGQEEAVAGTELEAGSAAEPGQAADDLAAEAPASEEPEIQPVAEAATLPETAAEAVTEDEAAPPKRAPRRRAKATTGETATEEESKKPAPRKRASRAKKVAEPEVTAGEPTVEPQPEHAEAAPAAESTPEPATAPEIVETTSLPEREPEPAVAEAAEPAEPGEERPRRTGWWQRRSLF